MVKFISCIVNQCAKSGWRYDRGSCLFNTRLILCLLLWMNITSLLIFIKGKKKGIELSFYKRNDIPIGFVILMLILYITIALISPKSRIYNTEITNIEKKKILFTYYFYISTSILLMILAGVFGKQ